MSSNVSRRVLLFGFVTVLSALVSVTGLAAQQAAPKAASAPTFDAVFDVNGSRYSGVTTFVVDAAGKVSGTMKLDQPAVVDAKLNGEVKAGTWTFNYQFTMDNQGQPCSGTLSGTAKVTADKAEATGSVSIGGSCSPDPLSGTFSFTKRK